ncbi:MAG: hypothetical protein FWD15_04435 [Alphaproteobacteria bacterium]|nr:hypothetical protein [Alphaproteobacteria bacterium]
MNDESFLTGYDVLRIPIEKDGVPAWPERFGKEKIESLRARVGDQKFMSQMMLVPVRKTGTMFDASALRFYSDELLVKEANGAIAFAIGGARIVQQSCWWDPSYASAGGDFSVIASVMLDDMGRRFVHDVLYIANVEDESVSCASQCGAVVEFLRRNFAPRVNVESNGIGKFLPEMLREKIALAGIECAVVAKNSKVNKAVRIADAFDACISSGRISFHERLKDTPFYSEFLEWSPESRTHDDGMDAVAGALGESPAVMPSRVKNRLPQKSQRVFRIKRVASANT